MSSQEVKYYEPYRWLNLSEIEFDDGNIFYAKNHILLKFNKIFQ
jgi:hypothetical protein